MNRGKKKEALLDRWMPAIIAFAVCGYGWILIASASHYGCDCNRQPTPAPKLEVVAPIVESKSHSILERE